MQSQHLNLWLTALGVAYPVALFARLRVSRSPWWMVDPGCVVILLGVVLFSAVAALVKVRQNGVAVTWVAMLAFPAWLGLVACFFIYLVALASASV